MANVEGIVTEDIAGTISPGQTVYDNEGKKVGIVENVNRDTGYFMVQANPFSEKDLFIPFNRITNVDPRELFVSVSKAELRRDYTNPPPRSTLVDDVDGKETAITTEVSGYDGAPVVVDRIRIDNLKKHIATGDHVYTSEMTDLGKIKQYDSVTGWMLVEKGIFSKHDMAVPVTVVRDVDSDSHDVYLAVSQADLERMKQQEPADVVFVEAEFKNGS